MMTAASRKITTLTLNPAIDETVFLDTLTVGAVQKAGTAHLSPGGKGINVAAALAANGLKVTATGILGSENADFFRHFFAANGIDDRFITLAGATRTNIKLVTPSETTDINLPGLGVTQAALDQVRKQLDTAGHDLLVLAGSLPPGCKPEFYAELVSDYAGKAKIIADCSGKPLQALLAGEARPFCIKPNIHELGEWAGKELDSRAAVLEQARKLQSSGIALVVVSMGKDGALFLTEHAAVQAAIKLDNVESTVGAGDAMVAGIAAGLLHDAPLEALARQATAWAAGRLTCHAPQFPAPAQLAELEARVTSITLD